MDISNVNTIIIQDADRMGLSQLYQLRGRVGRSNRTAYAYLMYKRDKMLKEAAEKRLQTIREFTAVEHRIEFVAEKNGVAYYNDSKGTNPDAAIKGIQAMNRPTFLIGGGYDKDSSYDEWIQSFDGKVKKLVLLGATKEKINETAKRLGFTDTILADTFEEAVNICVEQAEPGDAVLLSPACASWGMFKNYEERGDKFKELVNQL